MKEGAVTDMSASKYGRITSEKKEFPADEPVFVLRAQDILAADTLAFYADRLRKVGREKQGREVLQISKAFRKWPKKKMPD